MTITWDSFTRRVSAGANQVVKRSPSFWAFAKRRTAAAGAMFATRTQQHLNRCGISLRDLVWQTDDDG